MGKTPPTFPEAESTGHGHLSVTEVASPSMPLWVGCFHPSYLTFCEIHPQSLKSQQVSLITNPLRYLDRYTPIHSVAELGLLILLSMGT